MVITSRMTFRMPKRGYLESKFTRFITATYVRDNLNVIKHGWICSIQVSIFNCSKLQIECGLSACHSQFHTFIAIE